MEASGELEAALAESERLGLPLTAAQLSSEAPPDSENAAAGLLLRLEKWAEERKAARISIDPNASRTAAVAALHDPVLDFAAPLLARPSWHVERDYVAGPNIPFPEFARFKDLAKAFLWRAGERSQSGDTEGAIEDIASIGRLARHMSAEPFLIGGLISVAIDSIAGAAALKAAEDFADNPGALDRLIAAMDATAYDVPVLPSLKGEFYMGANTIRNLHHYGGMKGLIAMTGISEEMPAPPPRAALNDTDIPKEARQRASFARQLQFWNTVLGGEDQSLAAVTSRLDAEEKRLKSSNRPSEELLKILMPVLTQAGNAFARQHVMQDMRRATVLAAAFRAEKGRWPKDLAEIGVEIKNPLSGEPVGYAAQGARITLWTPEPGKEDKGAVFEAKAGERLDTWRIIWPDPKRG
jgi:hypothetical protein